MKTGSSVLIAAFYEKGATRRNLQLLGKFLAVLAVLVCIYSVAFHVLMALEGQAHSWLTGFYWTFTVMSTLGFGDITFQGDIGRLFSVVVLLSGMVFLLILLPFTFIEFFYAPWMAAQAAARAPRQLPESTRDHVIITHYDPLSLMLVRKLQRYRRPYVIIQPDLESALKLQDNGLSVMVGETNDPDTYVRARAPHAALVATTGMDIPNTNAVFTARQVAPATPIVATAKLVPTVEILELAGCSRVLRLDEMLGQFLARCTDGAETRAHIIGDFGPLLFAEANVLGSELVGKTLRTSELRQKTGLLVAGFWERGEFKPADPDRVITDYMVLVLAGSKDHIDRFNRLYALERPKTAPVVIIGGGRVGRATARALTALGIDYRIIEQETGRIDDPRCIIGDAAEISVLKQAGVLRAKTVLVTTRDDDINIYLTIFCRRLRPDMQIISRATLERNVATLHQAGADFVLSYSSLGANAIFNFLTQGNILMIAEGLNAFRVKVPTSLNGKSIIESAIRERSGCLLVAVRSGESTRINPTPDHVLEPGQEIILLGAGTAEDAFLKAFGSA
jgi:voltage-gated potassium channel